MENWQSEYLQFTLYILATVWLLQRGSPESKELGKGGTQSDEEQKVGAHATARSPRWAKVAGWRRTLYANSLLVAMVGIWLASWLVQSVTGRNAYNAEQFDHQQAAVELARLHRHGRLLEPHAPELAVGVPRRRLDGRAEHLPAPARLAGVEARRRSARRHGRRRTLSRLRRLLTTVIGSYPQPDWLIDRERLRGSLPARVRMHELWRVPEPFLAQAQDDATALAILDQERAGIDIISDGEIRRESYSNRFATALDGFDIDNPAIVAGRAGGTNAVPRIVGKVRRTRPVEVDDLRFLRSRTDRTIKITLPGPFTMSQQAANEFYDDEGELAMDLAVAVNEEVHDLFAAGADVVQIDEPWLQSRARRRARSRSPPSTARSPMRPARPRCTPASATPTSSTTGPTATRSWPSSPTAPPTCSPSRPPSRSSTPPRSSRSPARP